MGRDLKQLKRSYRGPAMLQHAALLKILRKNSGIDQTNQSTHNAESLATAVGRNPKMENHRVGGLLHSSAGVIARIVNGLRLR